MKMSHGESLYYENAGKRWNNTFSYTRDSDGIFSLLLNLSSQDLVNRIFMENVKEIQIVLILLFMVECTCRCQLEEMQQGPEYTWSIGASLTSEREIQLEQVSKKRSEEQEDLTDHWLQKGGIKGCLMFSLCCVTLISKTERKPVMRQRLVFILKEELSVTRIHWSYWLQSDVKQILFYFSQSEGSSTE